MECTNCAGTGTTIIAVIALILIIIAIIVFVILYFYPSNQSLLEVRGTNFNVINGQTTGSSNSTSESLITGANNLYISQPLTGNITLTLLSNSRNFVGMTIGIKNTTSDSSTSTITVVPGSGVTIDDGGITDGDMIGPSDFAWFVVTSIGATQTFTRLI